MGHWKLALGKGNSSVRAAGTGKVMEICVQWEGRDNIRVILKFQAV